MKARYYTIEEILKTFEDPRAEKCLELLFYYKSRFQNTSGSTHNHQAWQGGYHDHIQEVLNIGFVLYNTLNDLRPLPFSFTSAGLILFLHDIEKPWKYQRGKDGNLELVPAMRTKHQQHLFRLDFLEKHHIPLSPEELNALQYVEGENEDYKSTNRVAGELAAFCHLADITSARIWYNHPLENASSEPWEGASRIRE